MTKPIIRVEDVMQTEVISIDGMASVADAATEMRNRKVSEVLVKKRHDDDAWGIVTVMDIVNDVIVPGKEGDTVLVYEIMTKPIISVPADMDIRYAIRLIHRMGVHRAPVERNGEIVGMITLSSLVLENELF